MTSLGEILGQQFEIERLFNERRKNINADISKQFMPQNNDWRSMMNFQADPGRRKAIDDAERQLWRDIEQEVIARREQNKPSESYGGLSDQLRIENRPQRTMENLAGFISSDKETRPFYSNIGGQYTMGAGKSYPEAAGLPFQQEFPEKEQQLSALMGTPENAEIYKYLNVSPEMKREVAPQRTMADRLSDVSNQYAPMNERLDEVRRRYGVPGYQYGGVVKDSEEDDILATLKKGEAVLPKEMVDKVGAGNVQSLIDMFRSTTGGNIPNISNTTVPYSEQQWGNLGTAGRARTGDPMSMADQLFPFSSVYGSTRMSPGKATKAELEIAKAKSDFLASLMGTQGGIEQQQIAGVADLLKSTMKGEDVAKVMTPYGMLPANVAHQYMPELQEGKPPTSDFSLFYKSGIAIGKTPEQISKEWDQRVKGRIPPIYNFLGTSEGFVPTNIRTGQIGKSTGVGKPLPSEQITAGQQIGTLKETLDRVKAIYDSSWVGPIQGRVSSVAEKTVGIPEIQASFYADLAQMQNTLVYLMSGKQINEKEYERLKRQLPDRNLPSSTFKARMDNFEKTLNSIIAERQKLSGGYGQTKQVGENKTIVQTGVESGTNRKVIQYSDGSVEYAE